MGGGRMGGRNRFGFSDQRSEWESDASARLVGGSADEGFPTVREAGHGDTTPVRPGPPLRLQLSTSSSRNTVQSTTSRYWESFGRLRYDVMHAYLEPTRWVRHLDSTQWSKVNIVWAESGLHTGALRQLSCLMQLNETRVSRVSWMSVILFIERKMRPDVEEVLLLLTAVRRRRCKLRLHTTLILY